MKIWARRIRAIFLKCVNLRLPGVPHSRFFRLHQRHVNQVLAQKPDLQFVGAQHVADHQVIGAIVAEFVGALPACGNGQ